MIFLIEIFCKCSAATNGFNNATQFFCLCLCLCPDIKVWTCYVQISALKWGFTLNFQTQRQREGDKHFILGALLISSTALDWALLRTLPHHIHIITQQLILFPKSQHLELHRENPIGAVSPYASAYKNVPYCLCLLQACFPYVFFCKSPYESLHPIHNHHCFKRADNTNPRNTETRTVFCLMPVCCLAVTTLLVYLSLFCLLMELQLRIHEAVFSFRETWECVSKRDTRTESQLTSIQSEQLTF